jgi:hypothetical protein
MLLIVFQTLSKSLRNESTTVWKWLSIPRPGFHRQGFPGLGGNKAWGLGKEETAVRASTRPDEGGGSQPFLISIAPLGQAATQVPHPTHILIDRSIGESKGSSCSRSLWVQERAAAHEPVALSHERGSQRSKSMFAHLFTPNLQTEQVPPQRLPWQSNMSSLLYMILTILGGQAHAASVSTSAPSPPVPPPALPVPAAPQPRRRLSHRPRYLRCPGPEKLL